jgi:glucokinase-like ROK family protein
MSYKIKKNSSMVLGNRSLDSYKKHSLTDYILRLIWRDHQISRAEIAKKLGLSRSTVTEIVKELLQTGFIAEIGSGVSSGGRCPVVLEFQDNSKFIIGIDIGATHISIAVTNLRGKLLTWNEIKHPVREDPKGTWKLVIEFCKECLKDKDMNVNDLMSIGVAFPSPIDPSHPESLSQSIIPDWDGYSGIDQLSKHFKVPIYVDNDANLGALAEHWWGNGRGVDDLVYIKIANGIGAGYILGGGIYRGAKGIAGEMSHMSIDINGNQCGCGLKGCLATYLSSWALELRAKTLLPLFPDSKIKLTNPKIRMIEKAALNGDKLAVQIVQEAAQYLGVAITSIVNLFNPSMIIIGGSLSRVGDLLLEPIREKVKSTNLVPSISPTDISISKLGTQATAIGAATLALEETFLEPDFLNKRLHAGSI